MHRIFSVVLQLENIHKVEHAVSTDYSLKFVDQRGRLRLVSRIWNSFVVSTPEFWSLVDTTAMDPKLLSRRIERARQQQLCITHQLRYFTREDCEGVARFLAPYLDQIRTLRVGDGDVASTLLESSFPALRTLELRMRVWRRRGFFTIPQDHFPQLSALVLSDCFLPGYVTPFNTLRILHIHNSRTTEFYAFLRFLPLCPELEELTISSEDRVIWTHSLSKVVHLDKLRRIELRDLKMDCLLRFFGSLQIPNFKHAIFTLPIETVGIAGGPLQEILSNLQISSAGSGPVELSVFDDTVTCTTEDGRLVEVRLRGGLSSVSEECADTFLECLKPATLRIALELEDQDRVRWLNQVFERNNVTDLRIRLGRKALGISRAVIDYLALFDEETEEKSESKLLLSSLQTLVFEGGMVDIPHLLRMVASRVNGCRAASVRIQMITLINCDTEQWPDLSPRFRDLGVDLTLQQIGSFDGC